MVECFFFEFLLFEKKKIRKKQKVEMFCRLIFFVRKLLVSEDTHPAHTGNHPKSSIMVQVT
jgi:hypothetical protein